MQGKFITIEGCDGSGKSTQISLLKGELDRLGISYWLTREPGGTNISEKIRKIILDKNNQEMVWKTEALLYAASRAQLVEERILPLLKEGIHVICDRFTDSTLAYQGYGRNLDLKRLEKLNNFATQGLKPDLTILLDIDPLIAARRRKNQEKDRLENEHIIFHKRVRAGYLALAEKEQERFNIISATQDIQNIHREIMQKVLNLLIKV